MLFWYVSVVDQLLVLLDCMYQFCIVVVVFLVCGGGVVVVEFDG